MTANQAARLPAEAADVLGFWFGELTPEQWWRRDDAVDRRIRETFLPLYERLAEAVPAEWLTTAKGRLAAIIVLDQFPRNLFRGSARSFGTDPKALELARQTVALALDKELSDNERAFVYLPFEHSEKPEEQAESVRLYKELGNADSLDFAEKHKLIIERFGRFPHRNAMLGRESTEEERAFLEKESWFW